MSFHTWNFIVYKSVLRSAIQDGKLKAFFFPHFLCSKHNRIIAGCVSFITVSLSEEQLPKCPPPSLQPLQQPTLPGQPPKSSPVPSVPSGQAQPSLMDTTRFPKCPVSLPWMKIDKKTELERASRLTSLPLAARGWKEPGTWGQLGSMRNEELGQGFGIPAAGWQRRAQIHPAFNS